MFNFQKSNLHYQRSNFENKPTNAQLSFRSLSKSKEKSFKNISSLFKKDSLIRSPTTKNDHYTLQNKENYNHTNTIPNLPSQYYTRSNIIVAKVEPLPNRSKMSQNLASPRNPHRKIANCSIYTRINQQHLYRPTEARQLVIKDPGSSRQKEIKENSLLKSKLIKNRDTSRHNSIGSIDYSKATYDTADRRHLEFPKRPQIKPRNLDEKTSKDFQTSLDRIQPSLSEKQAILQHPKFGSPKCGPQQIDQEVNCSLQSSTTLDMSPYLC